MERLKRKRGAIRAAATILIDGIQQLLDGPHSPSLRGDLQEKLDLLKVKETALEELNLAIEEMVLDDKVYDEEIAGSQTYQDRICVAKSRAVQKLNMEYGRELADGSRRHGQGGGDYSTLETTVKLPKLEIPRFNGDLRNWNSFWDQFDSTINSNQSIAKVDKFKYLRSYLTDKAATAVSGLSLTAENYDIALDLLKERFSKKSLIIDAHMSRLLTLTKVSDSSQVMKLRELYDAVMTGVRSLEALDVAQTSYGVLLLSALRKAVPSDLNLEYDRKHLDGEEDLTSYLEFLRIEVSSRERVYDTTTKPEGRKGMIEKQWQWPQKPPPTGAALTVAAETTKCIFCESNEHTLENCDAPISIQEKKEKLKSQMRCFRCGRQYHRSRDCRNASRLRCLKCGRRHLTVMCDPINQPTSVESSALATSASLSTASSAGVTILLQTLRAWAESETERQLVRVLLDGGSQRSFIKQSLSKKLNCQPVGEEQISLYTFGTECARQRKCRRVQIWLRSQYDRSELRIEALEMPDICNDVMQLPSTDLVSNLHRAGMRVGDLSVGNVHCEPGIGILVGADYYWRTVTGEIQHISEDLVAANTVFGWTVQGPSSSSSTTICTNVGVMRVNVESQETELCNELRKFWDLEHIGIQTDSNPTHQDAVFQAFKSTMKNVSGRYQVALPWKTVHPYLPSNEEVARKRLFSLTKQITKNEHMAAEYDKAIRQYLDDGHAEKVLLPHEVDGPTYYMPHHAVVKHERETTKMRIVFDASSSAPGCPSLNDVLDSGPNLNPDLLAVLMRFRKQRIGVVADIEKAFLQISLNKTDRDAFRFFWYDATPKRDVTEREIEVWRMTRVPFGASSSPFIMAATLRCHFESTSSADPSLKSLCETLNESFYVDDLVTSVATRNEGERFSRDANEVVRTAGMKLRKWTTNSPDLQSEFRRSSEQDAEANSHYKSKKVLGLSWNTATDTLLLSMDSLVKFITYKTDTKRCLLQATARIFDPLGFLAPYTIKAKILFQRVWEQGLGWDDLLPDDLLSEWLRWTKGIPDVAQIAVPRALITEGPTAKHSVHCFCDASIQAYGAVVYLRTETDAGTVNVKIIAAKARVAPLKRVTLPRLELLAALIGARLTHYIVGALHVERFPAIFWSDSSVALCWIKANASRWKPFVANRVVEIQGLCDPSTWHYCPGEQNPADLLTRGVLPRQLQNNEFWWTGPKWLSSIDMVGSVPEPRAPGTPTDIVNTETKAVEVTVAVVKGDQCALFDLTKHRSFLRVLWITAWIKRFNLNCQRPHEKVSGPLLTEEINEAEKYWIRQVQRECFSDEYEVLASNGGRISSTSPLLKLSPYLDQDGILRLKGRLQESDGSASQKQPIILPKHHDFTKKLIMRTHLRLLHGGVRDTLVELRETYWVINGRQAVKAMLHRCLTCQKWRAKPAEEPMAPLPRDRVTKDEPFSVVGVDFAGPLYYKGATTDCKSYIVVFTCAITRAVHLEIVTDLSTATFLLAFRRFVSRRGVCHTVYSDNALTFKRASKDLRQLWSSLRSEEAKNYFSSIRLHWKFIVEKAAWWGGFYERMVRSVKTSLRKVLGRSSLTLPELTTVLTETEATINSRPITFVYAESEEPEPLTPSHLLIGKRLTRLPPFVTSAQLPTGTQQRLQRAMRYRESLLERFWRRWRSDCLQELRTAHWQRVSGSTDLQTDTLVLLKEDRVPRGLWKICRIVKTFPGRDGHVRSCVVQLPTGGTLRRAIQHLFPLEIQE
ncbi:uncharacterized protein LOC135384806 [Ornithodoros turicata]|uniref:uncharacterized protein LOC135384806 n=1 Tax=Ornithodoros turicata TaxID=34597 RepID=UPI00313A3272